MNKLERLLTLYAQIDPKKDWDIYYALRLKIIETIKEL